MAYGKLLKFAARNDACYEHLLAGNYFEAWLCYIREAPYDGDTIINDIDSEISTKRGKKLLTEEEIESLQYEALDYHLKRQNEFETEEDVKRNIKEFNKEPERKIDKGRINEAIKKKQREKETAPNPKDTKQEKLIKQAVKKNDVFFDRFKKRVERDIGSCKTYAQFVERTADYTTANILINSGYADDISSILTQVLNDHKYVRASQRQLLEETINAHVGLLIQDVGEAIKETVREVVKQGYDEGLHPTEIAKNITAKIDVINNTRARTIARTEVKRTDTVANYIRHKEKGATGFTVQCRPDCCELCQETYEDVDTTDKPYVGGDVDFTMDDTDMLPPLHPNCRCTAMFFY
jgi:hypothetical protein